MCPCVVVLFVVLKHAEEMILITEALGKEGFGPTQASADKVVRHLWWKNEHTQRELTKTEQSLKRVMSGDQLKLLQVGAHTDVQASHVYSK